MFFALIELICGILNLKVPTVFEYYSTRMIMSAVSSLGLTIFLGPWFIRRLYELRIGQTIRKEDCPLLGKLHEKKKDTPTMGGILMLCSMLISMLLWMDLTHSFTMLLFVTTLSLGALGAYDDYLKLKFRNTKGLSGRKKLLVQSSLVIFLCSYLLCPSVSEFFHCGDFFIPPIAKENIALASQKTLSTQEYMARLYLPFLKEPIVYFSGLGLALLAVFIFFVVTGSSNAVNLTDGLDGLAAGCLIMVSGTLGLFAFVSNNMTIAGYLNILYIEGSGEIGVYLFALAGACLGFLWYNGHPAQVFMGDTGSLTLGGIIGVAAVLLRREFLLSIVGGIFVVEALSVILQVLSFKYRNKKRIFLCAPIHHHFEYKGWPETKVVVRFWIIGLLLTFIGIASLKFQ
jgi:phospho-N-acetylmuramoyl-pentapeptide-transferase